MLMHAGCIAICSADERVDGYLAVPAQHAGCKPTTSKPVDWTIHTGEWP